MPGQSSYGRYQLGNDYMVLDEVQIKRAPTTLAPDSATPRPRGVSCSSGGSSPHRSLYFTAARVMPTVGPTSVTSEVTQKIVGGQARSNNKKLDKWLRVIQSGGVAALMRRNVSQMGNANENSMVNVNSSVSVSSAMWFRIPKESLA